MANAFLIVTGILEIVTLTIAFTFLWIRFKTKEIEALKLFYWMLLVSIYPIWAFYLVYTLSK